MYRLAVGIVCSSLGCESNTAEAPSRSRVQAVMAEPGQAATAEQPAQIAPAPPPARSVRPPLCEGELAKKPRAFKPAKEPRQLATETGSKLPPNPIDSSKRWKWINFWAAWCVPCKEELPLLLSWQRELSSDVQFAFISLDDDERQLREFLAQQPAGGLVSTYWLPDGPIRSAWLAALDLETEPELPLQLLLDESGQLRCRINGAVEASDASRLAAIVKD